MSPVFCVLLGENGYASAFARLRALFEKVGHCIPASVCLSFFKRVYVSRGYLFVLKSVHMRYARVLVRSDAQGRVSHHRDQGACVR